MEVYHIYEIMRCMRGGLGVWLGLCTFWLPSCRERGSGEDKEKRREMRKDQKNPERNAIESKSCWDAQCTYLTFGSMPTFLTFLPEYGANIAKSLLDILGTLPKHYLANNYL